MFEKCDVYTSLYKDLVRYAHAADARLSSR